MGVLGHAAVVIVSGGRSAVLRVEKGASFVVFGGLGQGGETDLFELLLVKDHFSDAAAHDFFGGEGVVFEGRTL